MLKCCTEDVSDLLLPAGKQLQAIPTHHVLPVAAATVAGTADSLPQRSLLLA
jgi:hypothetical protein